MGGAHKKSVQQLAQELIDLGFNLDLDILFDGRYKEAIEEKKYLSGQLKKHGLGEETVGMIMRRLDSQTFIFIGEHCHFSGPGVYGRIEGALGKLSLSKLGKERR